MKTRNCPTGNILVLGIGNILLTDEGAGVRALERLADRYEFSSNVTLMDGGTLGVRLLEPMMDADRLVILDAVRVGGRPGKVRRFTVEDLKVTLAGKASLHDKGIVEALGYAELLDRRPRTVIIGIEPKDITSWSTMLSDPVQAGLDLMVAAALLEIRRFGGECRQCAHDLAFVAV
jgi:hydrogenase maturation protease